MTKKSGIQKISLTTKKKSVKKKAGTVSASPEKKAGGKRQARSVAPKAKVVPKAKGKKTPVKKGKSEVKKQEKPVKKPGKTALIPPKKTATKRPTSKKTAKAPLKKSIKTVASEKAGKPLKATRAKTTATKIKRAREETVQKKVNKTKKAAGKPEKKITLRKTDKTEAPKTRKTPSKKLATAPAKQKKPLKRKASEKIEQAKPVQARRERKKRTLKKPTEVKQMKPTVVPKRLKEEKAFPSPKGIAADTRVTGMAPEEVLFLSAEVETLPSEYGENSITLMPVNPYKLFAFWEVRRETLKILKGFLNLRLYDVTGIDFATTDAHFFTDSTVSERVGKMYLYVIPAKEYVADIGIVHNGIFIGIARSPRVSTPGAGTAGEEEYLPEGFAAGTRVGY